MSPCQPLCWAPHHLPLLAALLAKASTAIILGFVTFLVVSWGRGVLLAGQRAKLEWAWRAAVPCCRDMVAASTEAAQHHRHITMLRASLHLPAGLDLPERGGVWLPLHPRVHLGHPCGDCHPDTAALVAAGQGLR